VIQVVVDLCETTSSHGGEDDGSLLGFDSVQTRRWTSTFRRSILSLEKCLYTIGRTTKRKEKT
jgi:hypothetical protein